MGRDEWESSRVPRRLCRWKFNFICRNLRKTNETIEIEKVINLKIKFIVYFHPYEKYNKDDRPIQTIATGLNKTDIRAGHEFKKPPIYLSSDQLINTANDNARKWKNC